MKKIDYWEQFREKSLTSPILYAYLQMRRSGIFDTDEDMLLHLCVTLANNLKDVEGKLVSHLEKCPTHSWDWPKMFR